MNMTIEYHNANSSEDYIANIAVSTVGTFRDAVYGALETLGGNAPMGGKILINASAMLPFTALEIAMTYEEEGLKKATITATAKTITGYTIGLIIGGVGTLIGAPAILTAVTGAIVAGTLGYFHGDKIDDIYDYFTQAQRTYPTTYIDPIIIDLNNDSKLSTTDIENGTYFDHGNDGFAETSSWVSPNDGILAIDKNNNGYIDNGNEIFGDNYIKSNNQKALNGFDALKDLDSNNDNIINSQDEAFSQIKILKGDGTILTLQEAGIESINLNTTTKNTIDENGNTLINQAIYTKTDGTEGILGDFNLKLDNVISINFSNQNNYLNMV